MLHLSWFLACTDAETDGADSLSESDSGDGAFFLDMTGTFDGAAIEVHCVEGDSGFLGVRADSGSSSSTDISCIDYLQTPIFSVEINGVDLSAQAYSTCTFDRTIKVRNGTDATEVSCGVDEVTSYLLDLTEVTKVSDRTTWAGTFVFEGASAEHSTAVSGSFRAVSPCSSRGC